MRRRRRASSNDSVYRFPPSQDGWNCQATIRAIDGPARFGELRRQGETSIMLLAVILALTGAPAFVADPRLPRRMEKANIGRDGATAETAYKVQSVREEYQIARALGVRTRSQALVEQDGKMFDVLSGTDADGKKRELWFDISAFFGAETDLITKALQ